MDVNLSDYMRISQKTKDLLWNAGKIFLTFFIIMAGASFVWVSTFDIPDLNAFTNRQVQQSTKIYDRTGEVVLYDLNKDVRRTKVPLSDISPNLQKATLAIEDGDFYDHHGIEVSAILRATWTNVKNFGFEQGGSTITQQVVKNTLLTPKKTISRKLKEWILAIRLDSKLDKNEILEIYLNETPYGGRVYGAEEAADRYFGKSASDLSITESAYIAALPKAPTYYSPYGNNRGQLESRKNEVLREMYNNDFITESEYESARSEEVTFLSQDESSIRAPHFVFFIKQYLEEEYGTTAIERRGLKVVTTLDYDLQKKAEDIISEHGQRNAERFNASNASLVAVDPNTGQIITMVGSREYDNEEIQGSFNAATAARQPGSSFKPFVYATAFDKGYTDNTVVFDLPTQFSAVCSASKFSSDDGCFSPVNYDDKFRGPITFRNALAQSVNIPAVKVLYLAGMEESLDTARNMGLNTLNKQPDQYGLSLVLGSGEVTLLDLTSAYGVFATEGVKHPHTGIMRIEDAEGEILEEFEESPERVLPTNTARQISDVLSDNTARTPAFGPNSPLHFPNYDVAAKTGTTNDYRDLWTIGYSPEIAVGVWSGNNDNTSIAGEVAGFVVAPMWQEFMQEALANIDNNSNFRNPREEDDQDLKPILRGMWQGGYINDDFSGGSRLAGGVHNILHWVDKDKPRGPVPSNPNSDPQYSNWEYSVQQWVKGQGFRAIDSEIETPGFMSGNEDQGEVDIDTQSSGGSFIELTSGLMSSYDEDDRVEISAENNGDLDRLVLYINGSIVDDDDSQPFVLSFTPEEVGSINEDENNVLLIRGYDEDGNIQDITYTFTIDN